MKWNVFNIDYYRPTGKEHLLKLEKQIELLSESYKISKDRQLFEDLQYLKNKHKVIKNVVLKPRSIGFSTMLGTYV